MTFPISLTRRTSSMMLCKGLFLVLVLFAVTFLQAQSPDAADTFLKKQIKERHITGMQVAVVKKGKIVFLNTYGFSYVQDSVKATNQSMFSINSCTKAFTGVAMMQLVEEGKVSLEAPISKYFDDLPASWQPITVRQLLTHVSGLPDILKLYSPVHNLQPGDSEEKMWATIKALPMDFPTGEQFAYNQTNYALLAKIIARFSGKSVDAVFRERQFNVAGMTHTMFADSRAVVPHLVQNYTYARRLDNVDLPEPRLIQLYSEFPGLHQAASGLVSTAEDMAKWIIALQQNKLLKAPALKTLWTAGTYNNGQPTQWAQGWMTRPRKVHSVVEATGGGRSAFCVYPEDDFAVIILTNLNGASPEDFIDEFAGYFDPVLAAADPLTALRMQLQKRGFDQAINIVKDFRKKDATYAVPEHELNDWGYRMMSKRQIKEAKAIFELVIWLYPDSWNAYDSYAESLMNDGQKEEAIKMYQKSVTMYPGNTNGKRILEKLQKG